MDLPPHQLRTLLTVARRLSFTRAAEELHLTQPAVSAHIRKLERAVGVPLFEQIGRRVNLTETGQVLVEYAERMLSLQDELAGSLADANEAFQGSLAIGTSTTIGISILPDLLRRFRAENPRVKLWIRVGMNFEMVADLLEGGLDLALIAWDGEDERLESVPVLEDEFVLVVPPSHRWAGLLEVEPEQLAGEPVLLAGRRSIGSFAEKQLAAAGATLDVVAESNSHIAIARMVETGIGVGIVLKHSVLDDWEQGRLWAMGVRGVDLRRTVSLVIHRDKHRSPAMRAFQELLAGVGNA